MCNSEVLYNDTVPFSTVISDSNPRILSNFAGCPHFGFTARDPHGPLKDQRRIDASSGWKGKVMFKALMVPVLATGLAFGGSAQKAEALTAEEVAAIAAGLIIVGAITSNNKAQSSTVTRSTPVRTTHSGSKTYNHRRALPADCVRRFDTDRGFRNVAINRCLQRTGVNVNRLPDRCEVRIRTDRGLRQGFRQRCLENAGYRFRDYDRHNGRVILDARTNR